MTLSLSLVVLQLQSFLSVFAFSFCLIIWFILTVHVFLPSLFSSLSLSFTSEEKPWRGQRRKRHEEHQEAKEGEQQKEVEKGMCVCCFSFLTTTMTGNEEGRDKTERKVRQEECVCLLPEKSNDLVIYSRVSFLQKTQE